MLRSVLFLICLLTPLSHALACNTDLVREYTPIAERIGNEMLFIVDNCKRPASYVLGTLHMDGEDIRTVAGPAYEALERSKWAAFELESGPHTQQQIISYMILPPEDQRKLSDIIGEESFSTLAEMIHKRQPGFPPPILQRYRPWAASVMLQIPEMPAAGMALDDQLQALAKQNNIPVHGLETVAEQMAVFMEMPEEEQVTVLQDTIENLDDIRTMNTTLRELYVSGDLEAIEQLGHKAFKEISDRKLRDKIRSRLIFTRNTDMTKAMMPLLWKGRGFVAVGALHLPGQHGILQKLEDRGYFIWPASVVHQHQ